MTKTEVARLLENSLSGQPPADWEHFVSNRQTDPDVERIRHTCAQLPERFPASEPGWLCGKKGLAVLKHLAEMVRNEPDERAAAGRPPFLLFILDSPEIQIYSNLADLLVQIEAIDVSDGVYEAYDSEGMRLELLVDDNEFPAAKPANLEPDALKAKIVKFYGQEHPELTGELGLLGMVAALSPFASSATARLRILSSGWAGSCLLCWGNKAGLCEETAFGWQNPTCVYRVAQQRAHGDRRQGTYLAAGPLDTV
jgi:hypothetical protein